MEAVKNWHRAMKSKDAEIWDELLGEDVVFYSPVVFTPQKGKKITMMYLMAATSVFGSADVDSESTRDTQIESKFRYVNEIIGEKSAVLEFESEIDGTYINGADLLSWDEDDKLVEVKVMVRPLQAVNMLHQKMKSMLESMS
ncbi:MAG TPA: hypothetical protein DEQ32_10175 [Gammaproteobacteria bacterium]|nr:hypothetical protein [Gammaproteobacteria bacterium]